MNITSQLPDAASLKQQAKRLRSHLAAQGRDISHSAALETLAHQHGYRDWNTLSAAAAEVERGRNERADMSAQFQVGGWVRGAYLGQPFTGEILGVQALSNGQYRLTLHFDDPVDVVEFDSFSAFRQRVTAIVRPDGVSPKKRSDGTPHLSLEG